MSANFYCWEPILSLQPGSSDFRRKIEELHRAPHPPPTSTMLKFVDSLLARYPDLTETEDTVWADGPLKGNIIGEFINMGIMWSGYVEAVPFVIATAHSFGLHAYDPQDEHFYPAPHP